MSIFKLFGTSKSLEKDGIWITYPGTKFLVARAGGSNIAFNECLKAKTRAVKFQLDRDTLPLEEGERISAEVYAEVVIKDVQVQDPATNEWVRGLPVNDGTIKPFTKQDLIVLLLEMPDMFRDLRTCAGDFVKYLKDDEAADLKNS